MIRMYTYMTKNETVDEALEKGRFFLTEEDLIDYLEKAEEKYKVLFPESLEDPFECAIISVNIKVGKALKFKNGKLSQDDTE